MYIYMYSYNDLCVGVHIHAHTHTQHTYRHVHIHRHTYTHTHMHACVDTSRHCVSYIPYIHQAQSEREREGVILTRTHMHAYIPAYIAQVT